MLMVDWARPWSGLGWMGGFRHDAMETSGQTKADRKQEGEEAKARPREGRGHHAQRKINRSRSWVAPALDD
eukprot:12886294-Prorocentrum_lima.AAC.1